MRTWGKFVVATISAATLFVALVEPAEARRRFRFGSFGGGTSFAEKIDKVYDLPDTETYLNGGQYYDLGSFYEVRNGSEIRPATPVFVLYNGDRYIRLDATKLALIQADLGMDPTADYRARYIVTPARPKSANQIERSEGETVAEFRARARGMAERGNSAERTSAAPAGTGALVMLFLPMLVIGGLFAFGLRKFLRRRVANTIAGGDETPAPLQTASFDQRIAARLRELEGGQPEMTAAVATPAPRTFGRKLA